MNCEPRERTTIARDFAMVSWPRAYELVWFHEIVVVPIVRKEQPGSRVAGTKAVGAQEETAGCSLEYTSAARTLQLAHDERSASRTTKSCSKLIRYSYLPSVDTCRRPKDAGDHVLCRSDGAVLHLQLVCHCRLQFHMRSLVRHAVGRLDLLVWRYLPLQLTAAGSSKRNTADRSKPRWVTNAASSASPPEASVPPEATSAERGF